MAELEILKLPDPRLREASAEVTHFDQPLADFVADLTETLYGTTGIGLSAPQVGDPRRIFVMDLSASRSEPQVFINPKILGRSVLARVEESCLSIPGVEGMVLRHIELRVEAFDVEGRLFERELQDMEAVCVQHEIDHLNGILFVDRLPLLQRLKLRLFQGIRTIPPQSLP